MTLRENDHINEEMLKEIEEYERKYLRPSHRKPKRAFPSNEDIVEAIRNITGGILTRWNAEQLFEAVKKYLEDRGFDTSRVTEGRVWRLATNMVKKGMLKVID
ncbi:MAG: hypothetical protein DRO15_05365 [Thermoprotei archaeon]|nr:MAG: hypothetical protein DRO15_05365 [Thermoprotei archaeon]